MHDEALRGAQHAQFDGAVPLEAGRHRPAPLAEVMRPLQVDRGVVLLWPHQLRRQQDA